MPERDALAAALRLLQVRDRSEGELARRLARKDFAEPEVRAALERCRQLGYLDDHRFAETRARQLMEQGRAVGPRLEQELRRLGLPSDLIRETLGSLETEVDAGAVLATLCRRRFPDFRLASAPDREKARVVGFLRRRGFPLGMILETLQRLDE